MILRETLIREERQTYVKDNVFSVFVLQSLCNVFCMRARSYKLIRLFGVDVYFGESECLAGIQKIAFRLLTCIYKTTVLQQTISFTLHEFCRPALRRF